MFLELALIASLHTQASPSYDPNKFPLDLSKCQPGSSNNVEKPATTTTNISVGGIVIPQGSQIYVIGQTCNQGQRTHQGQAPNFWSYLIRYRGQIYTISGGSFNYN
jgi:hypothetical protein